MSELERGLGGGAGLFAGAYCYLKSAYFAFEQVYARLQFLNREAIEQHADHMVLGPGADRVVVHVILHSHTKGRADFIARGLAAQTGSLHHGAMNTPTTMIAIPISTPGGPEVLVPKEVPVPDVGPRDVLIHVAAAGVNSPDIAQRKGTYPPPPGALPLPGLEVAGTVAAVGAEVEGFALGERVMALCNGGGYAHYVAVPQGQVLPVPVGWELGEAAALPETWFTVTQTLVMRAGLEAGMWVLVHGAAGGIGGAAVQISRLLGARPIAVVSSDEKADYARSLGAEAVIVHTREDVVERVKAITDGHGADRVLDIMGGEMTARNVEASASFGHIVQVSTMTGGNVGLPLRQMMAKQLTLSGSTLRPQTAEAKAGIAETIGTRLLPLIAGTAFVRPRIQFFALEDAADAHRALEERASFGKMVLLTGADRR